MYQDMDEKLRSTYEKRYIYIIYIYLKIKKSGGNK